MRSPVERLAFRLSREDPHEYRFRWGRSLTMPADDARKGITLEDYPDFTNQRIAIRLCVDWRTK